MVVILLFSRLLLAVVFFVASLAKLADRKGSEQALADFGVPAVLKKPFGILLPIAELITAVALLPSISAWWGALSALVLLLLFVVGIGINLALGRKPDCHCFGQLYSAPVSWSTLARNGILAALAGFIVWQGPDLTSQAAMGSLLTFTFAETVTGIAIVLFVGLLALEGWLLFHLLRQNGRLLLRIEALEKAVGGDGIWRSPSPAPSASGLPIGTPAPAFQLPGLYGETLTLDALRSSGKPLMLIFSDPGCGPCSALMPEIAMWQRDYALNLTIALISRGMAEINREKNNQYRLTHILLQQDREVAESYLVDRTPSAVIVQSDGAIASTLAAGADEIRDLLMQIVGTSTPTRAPAALPATAGGCGCGDGNGNGSTPTQSITVFTKIGARAPGFKLADLNGKMIDLTDFLGSQTLVLFWNPGCGFCNRMLDDLKAWESNPPKRAPKLLVVSTGSVNVNQALGLRSPIVLDQGFSVGRLFGANGTPSAVLVDKKGNIASNIAVGAPAVLALAYMAKPASKVV